jgi:hypothetical protein
MAELEDGRTGVDITLKYNTADITEDEMQRMAGFVLRAKEFGCGCPSELTTKDFQGEEYGN